MALWQCRRRLHSAQPEHIEHVDAASVVEDQVGDHSVVLGSERQGADGAVEVIVTGSPLHGLISSRVVEGHLLGFLLNHEPTPSTGRTFSATLTCGTLDYTTPGTPPRRCC